MNIKQIESTKSNLIKYQSQKNVIRQTKRESTIRFGKLVITTDADPDG